MDLTANAGKSLKGCSPMGMGFILTEEERRELLAKERRAGAIVLPFIGGEDLNKHPRQESERFIINFGQQTLQEAGRWPTALEHVSKTVKPEREKLKNNSDGLRYKKYWWQFGRPSPALFTALATMDRVLVCAIVSKHLMFSFQPSNRVFSNKVYAFLFEDYAHFAVLQSRIHSAWTWLLSSTMKNDLNYSASDCFETFPLPFADGLSKHDRLNVLGSELYEARSAVMAERGCGLTVVYNHLKDPELSDRDIEGLRNLHLEVDRAVLAAYGWSDIKVPSYTLPMTDLEWKNKEAFEDEVTDRLFTLNSQRATEQRLHGVRASEEKPKGKGSKKAGAKKPSAQTSFEEDR